MTATKYLPLPLKRKLQAKGYTVAVAGFWYWQNEKEQTRSRTYYDTEEDAWLACFNAHRHKVVNTYLLTNRHGRKLCAGSYVKCSTYWQMLSGPQWSPRDVNYVLWMLKPGRAVAVAFN